MNKNVVIGIVLAALILIAGIQMFQLSGLKKQFTGGSAAVSAGSGESNEEMMARMHPDQVKKQKAVATPSGLDRLPNMVGGC